MPLPPGIDSRRPAARLGNDNPAPYEGLEERVMGVVSSFRIGRVLRRLAAPATAVALALAAAMPASAQNFIGDAEIEQILHEFGDPLFEVAGIKPSDVRIYINQDETLNAGVGGGANMVINTGLILEC